MVKITGSKEFSSRLSALGGPRATATIGRALFEAGQQIENEAAISMTRGRAEVQDKKKHVPSRPGEPPAVLYGDLRRSLETVQLGPATVEVSADDPKSVWLEYGTSRMAERPYMRPAVANTEAERQELFARLAVNLAKGDDGE
jgi:hypothetical protein